MSAFDFTTARVLRTILPDRDPVPLTRPATPLTSTRRRGRGPRRLVARFGVGGHPGQWVTHGTSGSKAGQRAYLCTWQDKVANVAAGAMRDTGQAVEVGPVEVWIDFVLRPAKLVPDRDNLQKGTTDALQGVVFLNDNQVVGGECRRLVGPHEGVVIEVWAVALLGIGVGLGE